MTEAAMGRRERKRARTRQVIAEAALGLFLERGFDQVGVREVAEAADVSMSGLFNYFPTKESLVFDQDDDVRAGLVSAVRDRPGGTPVLESLLSWFLSRPPYDETADARFEAYVALTASTPALRRYAQRMWLGHEEELARAIIDSGPDVPGAPVAGRALARFVLDRAIPFGGGRPRDALRVAFTLLADGWESAHPSQAAPEREPAPAAEIAVPPRPQGLRERKKAQTRQALSDAALRLFIERGYDEVGVREIAEAAGTSIATLFKYFPGGKVSLIFPEDQDDRATALAATVRDRPAGQPLLLALRDFMIERGPFKAAPSPAFQRRLDMITATPELREHARHLWLSSQDALADAIAADSGLGPDDPAPHLLARYVLQTPDLASAAPDPRTAMDTIFTLLRSGWPPPG